MSRIIFLYSREFNALADSGYLTTPYRINVDISEEKDILAKKYINISDRLIESESEIRSLQKEVARLRKQNKETRHHRV